MSQDYVTLTQVQPRGPRLIAGLAGDAEDYAPSSAGSSGGLQIVDRPLRKAAVQWFDAPIWQLELPLIFEAPQGGDVEAACLTVEAWIDNSPGAVTLPVIRVKGPVPGTQRLWLAQDVSFGTAIRNGDGRRTLQNFTLTLWEYSPVLATYLTESSPAARAARAITASTSASARKYTVRAGDTLSSIAARQLGDYRLWTVIAELNGIRDPSSIRVGQILVLPQT